MGWRGSVSTGVGSCCYSSTKQFKYGCISAIERSGSGPVDIQEFVCLRLRLKESSAVKGMKQYRSTSVLHVLPPNFLQI